MVSPRHGHQKTLGEDGDGTETSGLTSCLQRCIEPGKKIKRRVGLQLSDGTRLEKRLDGHAEMREWFRTLEKKEVEACDVWFTV